MTGTQIAVMVAAFVIIDLFVIAVVLGAAGRSAGLAKLAAKYPPTEPAPGAVRKGLQSFSFGLINLGGCIHVAVDEHRLHLSPAWLARTLVRMRPMSIPWDAIKPSKYPGRSRRWATVAIDGVDVRGPRWCLDLDNA